MNPEIKALWVKELRSGDFEQGKMALRQGQKCCCLGVLCELAYEAGVPLQIRTYNGEYEYDGSNATLPRSVRMWAGLDEDNPHVPGPNGFSRTLSSLNDHECNFKSIADLIEASDL